MTAVAAWLAWSGMAAAAPPAPQQFFLYQGPGQAHFTVHAAGPISGAGTDVLLEEGTDAQGRTRRRTETTFPAGTTFNTLTVLENHIAFDPASCVARVTGRSRLDITGGTGAYEGATGGGEVTFQAIAIGRHTAAGCSLAGASTYAFAHISGTSSLPG